MVLLADSHTSPRDEAAYVTLGVPAARAWNLTEQVSPSPSKKSSKKRGYAVFHGLEPAAYRTWYVFPCSIRVEGQLANPTWVGLQPGYRSTV